MKIKPNKSLIRSLTKSFWRDTRRVLIKVRQPVVDQAEFSDPETLRLMVPALLQSQPMVDHLGRIWGKVGGISAFIIDRTLNEGKKEAKKTLSEHEARMRAYAYQRSLLKAKKILDTEAEAINRVISEVVDRAIVEGLSTQNTRRLMKESLQSELTTIENWQAERIARTEVGSAYNTAAFEESKNSGVEMKKEWLHSGKYGPGYRENHVGFQELGPVEMDYEYAPGLQFPQDENADADEIINCRCTMTWDVD